MLLTKTATPIIFEVTNDKFEAIAEVDDYKSLQWGEASPKVSEKTSEYSGKTLLRMPLIWIFALEILLTRLLLYLVKFFKASKSSLGKEVCSMPLKLKKLAIKIESITSFFCLRLV